MPIRLRLFLMRSQPVAYSQSYSCSLVSDESFSCCFQDFSLYLPTVWLWSMFIIPGVPQASWICRLIISIKFRKYLAILLLFSAAFSHFPPSIYKYLYIHTSCCPTDLRGSVHCSSIFFPFFILNSFSSSFWKLTNSFFCHLKSAVESLLTWFFVIILFNSSTSILFL